jgi:biotin operon repressor
MGKRGKGFTRIGIMAGAEVGADFFKPWRAERARRDFLECDVDFILFPGGLLNLEALNTQMAQFVAERKREDKRYKLTPQDHQEFCDRIIATILRDVFPPIRGSDKELIKYWVFPAPLFELKKDKFGIAVYIYENLERASLERTKQHYPYIRVGNEKDLIEIEDDVAIKTIGIIMPTTSFFRAKILSTPIEREITYRQFSSLASPVPDLYVAGSFAASISEVNPRGVPLPRPYVSVPSLSIKFTETVLQNSLGYAILTLHQAEKHAQFETRFVSLNDAFELECAYADREANKLRGANQRKVAKAIIEKMRLGTKVTLGKLEVETDLSREEILKTLEGLRRKGFDIEEELGEIKNPYKIIPYTNKDLTQYRTGETRQRSFVAAACLHIADDSVDYDFLERSLPRILAEEETDTLYLVGDITEGNKYNQDRKGELLDRFPVPQQQKELAGFLMAYVTARAFKSRLEKMDDWHLALPRVVTIPGNHDEIGDGPPLELYHDTFVSVLTKLLYRHLKERFPEKSVDYVAIEDLVRKKILLLSNPDVDRESQVGLLHEYSGSAEQSTFKTQKASKQFLIMSQADRVLLANHHEENFLILRVGNRTIELCHIGTLKRLYGFESQRSKISEFGVAVIRDTWENGQLVQVDIKFIPSMIDFEITAGKDHQERNKSRGIAYYEMIKQYKKTKELPPID